MGIPITDVGLCAAHIADAADRNNCLYVLHSVRGEAADLVSLVTPETAVACVISSDDPIKWGDWIVLGTKPLDYVPELPDRTGTWSSYKNVESLARAIHGLEPWDGMANPKYYHRFLLDPATRPTSARSKSELGAKEQKSIARQSLPSLTEVKLGATEYIVELHLLGDNDLCRQTAHELERLVAQEHLGEVDAVETGVDGVVMQITCDSGLALQSSVMLHVKGLQIDVRVDVLAD